MSTLRSPLALAGSHVTRILFAALALVSSAPAGAAAPTISPPAGVLLKAEAEASPAVKLKLSAVRSQAQAEGLTFQIGYTAALDFSIEQITGLVPPANLKALAKQQNVAVGPRLAAAQPAPGCSSSASSFDWRSHGGATPVRDQGPCGSCWAFGTHAAFEGAWGKAASQQIDSSEQETLSCSGAGSCNGGWWAFDFLVATGASAESDYPYTAADDACRDVKEQWKAAAWGYVDPNAEIPSEAKLKEALCRFGPLAVAVEVTTPFQAYQSGVFNEHATGSVNHAVTLIGWNDPKRAWLIKNSWGTAWGETGGLGSERGYMWIAWDSNQIGYGAAWVQPEAPVPSAPKK